jgi:hypothetical protein
MSVGADSGEEGAARLVACCTGVAPSAGDGGGVVDAIAGVANGLGGVRWAFALTCSWLWPTSFHYRFLIIGNRTNIQNIL